MFFIGVFGTGYKEKVIDGIAIDQCPGCGGTHTGQVVVGYSYFQVFFIPVYRWNQEYTVICPACRTQFRLDPEVGSHIENGTLKSLNFWQLKNGAVTRPQQCEKCGSQLEPGFQYCPRCGEKRRP